MDIFNSVRKTLQLPALSVLLSALPLWGQCFHAGLKLGVPLTQYFETGAYGGNAGNGEYSSATRRYLLGVSGEWRVMNAFGFEIDALYHRIGYVANTGTGAFDSLYAITSAVEVKGSSWDLPIMAKYRFSQAVLT
jgi:hypothetical protein